MTQTPDQTMSRLAYLGLLPFVITLLCIWLDKTLFGLEARQVFIAYSAVILSFLAGILWGNAIDHIKSTLSRNTLLLSILFAVIAWGVLLRSPEHYVWSLLALLFGFIAIWFAEKKIREVEKEGQPASYQPMRNRLTGIVALLHLIALAS
ncbi:DUF3429 domain-containing protein [Photobacterium ganghwense]|uniref:DUF3429 domain-containing protein n=1 Tax=Photobacterium ganghwense TaxID=320778 RepID=A0A0J1GXX3_9GAMM|nr:DUF3429 domain-containing protein [Photobacterium ganghwense]KLV04520.1 hypothetical protein ABT57_23350 [Photobacterium ganghwense]PSU09396.1 DUF3429 domain-containing protein [Photobacterium ganghwense]QSV16587.1 DUF3429 domain-containing protein [Photobacterium ganghwense]